MPHTAQPPIWYGIPSGYRDRDSRADAANRRAADSGAQGGGPSPSENNSESNTVLLRSLAQMRRHRAAKLDELVTVQEASADIEARDAPEAQEHRLPRVAASSSTASAQPCQWAWPTTLSSATASTLAAAAPVESRRRSRWGGSGASPPGNSQNTSGASTLDGDEQNTDEVGGAQTSLGLQTSSSTQGPKSTQDLVYSSETELSSLLCLSEDDVPLEQSSRWERISDSLRSAWMDTLRVEQAHDEEMLLQRVQALRESSSDTELRLFEEEAKVKELEGRWETLKEEHNEIAAQTHLFKAEAHEAAVTLRQLPQDVEAEAASVLNSSLRTASSKSFDKLQETVLTLERDLRYEKQRGAELRSRCAEEADAVVEAAKREAAESKSKEVKEQQALLLEEEELLNRLLQKLLDALIVQKSKLKASEESMAAPSRTASTPRLIGSPKSPASPKSNADGWPAMPSSPHRRALDGRIGEMSLQQSPYRRSLDGRVGEVEQKRRAIEHHMAGREAMRRACMGLTTSILESTAAMNGSIQGEEEAQDLSNLQWRLHSEEHDASLRALQRSAALKLEEVRCEVVKAKEQKSAVFAHHCASLHSKEELAASRFEECQSALAAAAQFRDRELASRQRRVCTFLQEASSAKKELREAEEEAEALREECLELEHESRQEMRQRRQELSHYDSTMKHRSLAAQRFRQQAENGCESVEERWLELREEVQALSGEHVYEAAELASAIALMHAEERQLEEFTEVRSQLATRINKICGEVAELEAADEPRADSSRSDSSLGSARWKAGSLRQDRSRS